MFTPACLSLLITGDLPVKYLQTNGPLGHGHVLNMADDMAPQGKIQFIRTLLEFFVNPNASVWKNFDRANGSGPNSNTQHTGVKSPMARLAQTPETLIPLSILVTGGLSSEESKVVKTLAPDTLNSGHEYMWSLRPDAALNVKIDWMSKMLNVLVSPKVSLTIGIIERGVPVTRQMKWSNEIIYGYKIAVENPEYQPAAIQHPRPVARCWLTKENSETPCFAEMYTVVDCVHHLNEEHGLKKSLPKNIKKERTACPWPSCTDKATTGKGNIMNRESMFGHIMMTHWCFISCHIQGCTSNITSIERYREHLQRVHGVVNPESVFPREANWKLGVEIALASIRPADFYM